MASQTAVGNMTGVEFMGIQHSESGSISQINDTAYTLELNYVSDKAILFSDRPERIVDSVITSDFVGNWTTGPNSFVRRCAKCSSRDVREAVSLTMIVDTSEK